MSDVDKRLKIMNDGRMAALAFEHMHALITEQKNKRILEISQNFRMGKVDQATLISSVSGFCALEDLENEIKRKIVRSEIASNAINKEQLK